MVAEVINGEPGQYAKWMRTDHANNHIMTCTISGTVTALEPGDCIVTAVLHDEFDEMVINPDTDTPIFLYVDIFIYDN